MDVNDLNNEQKQNLKNDATLTDSQIETIRSWVLQEHPTVTVGAMFKPDSDEGNQLRGIIDNILENDFRTKSSEMTDTIFQTIVKGGIVIEPEADPVEENDTGEHETENFSVFNDDPIEDIDMNHHRPKRPQNMGANGRPPKDVNPRSAAKPGNGMKRQATESKVVPVPGFFQKKNKKGKFQDGGSNDGWDEFDDFEDIDGLSSAEAYAKLERDKALEDQHYAMLKAREDREIAEDMERRLRQRKMLNEGNDDVQSIRKLQKDIQNSKIDPHLQKELYEGADVVLDKSDGEYKALKGGIFRKRTIEIEDEEDIPEYDLEKLRREKFRGDRIKAKKGGEEIDAANYIDEAELEKIRDALVNQKPQLVIRGMQEEDAREELRKEVMKSYRKQTAGGQPELVDYIVREVVGTGVVEQIIEHDKSITDIGYDGEKLIVESSDKKFVYSSGVDVDDEYINRLISKFALANNREFTTKSPIFDGQFRNIRINAVHNQNTVGGGSGGSGPTMALRVVRPRLALTEESFETFAPHYIFEFLQSMVLAKANIMISGETGTGKTELQKLLASFIPFDQRIVLIEDVGETFLKDMFNEKDIYSWLTSESVSITALVKASLRNNPRWILVSETRGQEAYEMIQAVLSGHSIITTLHAINSRAIPKRLINMAKMGYQFSEEALEEDIINYFDLGVHIVRRSYKGKTLRYCAEIIYFNKEADDKGTMLFKQDFYDGQLIAQTGEIPVVLKRRIENAGASLEEFGENRIHRRIINVDEVQEQNRTRLDLSFEDGDELSYAEAKAIVPEMIMSEDAFIKANETREALKKNGTQALLRDKSKA